jgi:hypothetical protein
MLGLPWRSGGLEKLIACEFEVRSYRRVEFLEEGAIDVVAAATAKLTETPTKTIIAIMPPPLLPPTCTCRLN